MDGVALGCGWGLIVTVQLPSWYGIFHKCLFAIANVFLGMFM